MHSLNPATLMHGLSGFTLVRDCIKLDYHFRETIQSMLPVCDEVLVCDCDSSDGTREVVQKWMWREPKLRYINWPFTNPVGDRGWSDKWMNFARVHLHYDMALYLDADHVVGPESYPVILDAAARGEVRNLHYVYFWGDPQHWVPWGNCLSPQLFPTRYWLPGQNDIPAGEVNIRELAEKNPLDPNLVIYSYSTLRRREAFFEKCKLYGTYMEGSLYDEALEKSKADGSGVCTHYPGKDIRLFTGNHPPCMRQWLEERGHTLPPDGFRILNPGEVCEPDDVFLKGPRAGFSLREVGKEFPQWDLVGKPVEPPGSNQYPITRKTR